MLPRRTAFARSALVLALLGFACTSAAAQKGKQRPACGTKAALYLAQRSKSLPQPRGWGIDKLWVVRVGSIEVPATVLDILLPDGTQTAAVGHRPAHFFAINSAEEVNGEVRWSQEPSRLLPPSFRIVTKGDELHVQEGVVFSFKACEDPPSPERAFA